MTGSASSNPPALDTEALAVGADFHTRIDLYFYPEATSPSVEERLTVSQRSVEEDFQLQRHQNESARGAQPSQSDRDEPADRGLGRQAAGCREGVEAVARKLVRRDIVADVAGLCSVGQQVSDEVAELLLRSDDVLTSMQECREFDAEFDAVVLVGNERVSFEYSFESLASVASLVPDFGEMFEVAGDLTFVPGEQDRFDA